MPTAIGRLLKPLTWLGPAGRIGVFAIVVLGLLIGWFSWSTFLFVDIERALLDLRGTPQQNVITTDNRVVLVTFNDDTRARIRRAYVDRQLLAAALRTIDTMHPRAIGIDIIFDQEEPGTDVLVAALRQMRTPTFVAFANAAPGQLTRWQESYLRDFVTRTSNERVRPMSIRLRADEDGVIRRWPSADTAPPGAAPLSPNALTRGENGFSSYEGPIAFRTTTTDNPVFANIPVEIFGESLTSGLIERFRPWLDRQYIPGQSVPPELMEGLRPFIEGRYILIGGAFPEIDEFETPMTRLGGGYMNGVEVQAHMLAQLLDNRRLPTFPDWAKWLAPIIIMLAALPTAAMRMRRLVRVLLITVQIGFLMAVPFFIQAWTTMSYGVPAMGWLVAWLCGFFAVRLAARAVRWEQGRLAQSALHRYLPPEVAAQILDRPDSLTLAGEKKMVYILFSDLEGFTTLCHSLPAAEVATILNKYLERLSQVVLDHGGTIDKFVGDAVIAFWGAPFSKPDDGEKAAMAAIAVHKAGEEFRRQNSSEAATIGRTRVGLHYGEAIVGNFGGEGRIQYTALGDTMNVAARLEGANKQLGTSVLVSKAAAEHSSAILYRTLGFITVRGRQTAVEVSEPSSGLTADEVEQNNAWFAAASAGDEAALDRLEKWSVARPTDEALRGMIERIKRARQGESVVLQ